jgi:hypothetical protein
LSSSLLSLSSKNPREDRWRMIAKLHLQWLGRIDIGRVLN